jgi:rubrerythrin
MELAILLLIAIAMLAFALLAGAGRARDEMPHRGRWESAFYAEAHREVNTDATGVLMCRRCGASGSERAGRCPSCGASL